MLKYKILCSLITLFAVTLFSSCRHVTHAATAPPKFNASLALNMDNFSIALPTGWKYTSRQLKGHDILFLVGPNGDDFSPNMNVISEYVQNITLDSYVDISNAILVKKHMTLDGGGKLIINGDTARYTTSNFVYYGKKIANRTYFIVKNGVAYVLTGMCLATQKESYRPFFDATVQTFRIK